MSYYGHDECFEKYFIIDSMGDIRHTVQKYLVSIQTLSEVMKMSWFWLIAEFLKLGLMSNNRWYSKTVFLGKTFVDIEKRNANLTEVIFFKSCFKWNGGCSLSVNGENLQLNSECKNLRVPLGGEQDQLGQWDRHQPLP